MVTLRTYSNPAEAAMAKSRLDDRQIFCSLADENVNRLGGAPFAMPIRLLVAEDQEDEARRILAEGGLEFPDDVEIVPTPSTTSQDPRDEVLVRLDRLQGVNQWIGLAVIVLLALTIYLIVELPARVSDPWAGVSNAMRQRDYPTALKLALPLVAAQPRDSYGHEYLGTIYRDLGNLAQAEKEYSRALELLPPERLEAKLAAVKKRRAQESASTSPSPTP